MARFFYRAKKGPKEIIEGIIDAEAEAQALSKVSALGLFPVYIKKEEEAVSVKGASSFGFQRRIRTVDLAVFTRQLADLLEAGLPLTNALDILARQTENKRLSAVTGRLRDDIKGGSTFSYALSQHPSVFSSLYASMVSSGETSGALEEVLNRLADFLEGQEEFKTKVQAALAYPILMASVGLITIVVLLTFVMPRVVGIFEDLGQNLPLITTALLGISKFLRNFWYIAVSLILLLFFAIREVNKTSEGKSFLDRLKAGLPLIGVLLQKADIARFARTLGTLLHNGVTILHALEIVKNIVSNESAKRQLGEAFNKVRDGVSLAKALSGGGFFPLFVINMIAVGEESGQLERSLFKIADSYERQADKQIKIISSLIEPVMILVMGLVVGFIVISILLPIFQISLIAR